MSRSTRENIFKLLIKENEPIDICRAYMNNTSGFGLGLESIKQICDDNDLLYIAFTRSTVDVLKLLLDTGADPTLLDRDDPLIYRVSRGLDDDSSYIMNWDGKIKLLLDYGANPNIHVKGACTVLCNVITSSDPPFRTKEIFNVIEILLRAGANPNTRCSCYSNKTPLDFSAQYKEITFLLLRYGAIKYRLSRYHNNTNDHYRVTIRRVLIVCDMMLYMDKPDWIREIKECLY